MSRVFDRFAPFIQDFIYAHEWESLRGVQVAAAEAIFDTDAHVLLTSGTASGKTEAAFFPILTEFWETPPTSVGAIYIGPLKALINDQFYRLQDLCEEADINVWHWHGDVSASHKARLMKKPSGILQITPESLEAMLMRRHSAIPHLFGDLRYIVVDEVHSLLRGDRGGQTLCLMERLCRLANVSPRRICLSATIGDPEAVARLISWGTGRTCVIPQIAGANQRWRIMMEHFYTSGPQASHATPHVTGATQHVDAIVEEVDERALPQDTSAMVVQGPDGEDPFDATEEGTSGVPAVWDPGIAYVYTHSRGRKCLVFSNSREDCEAMCSTLRSYCEADGEPDRFLIHHGNLSASFRETAEELMRDEELMLTCCTTATLELGIDIGRLERAFQMDAPFTVSAFLQRMGRTGRRGAPSEMAFVIREDPPEPRALVAETVPWKLLQAIALVELYLKERYVEPPRLDRLPFSLLYHQTMSTLASSGEMSAAELASRVLTLPYFHRITPDDYRVLLRHLLEIDHIERTETGGLIVGLAGERVTNGFRFYGVFVESEEYTVRSESAELGTVVQPPPIGEKLAICGSVWIVEDIDHKRRIVECTQVKGKVPAYFGECPGDIQTKVLERMRMVLTEPGDFRYLSDNARARLAHARTVATYAHIGREPLINLGGDMWALFPWLGTYAFLALERTIKLRMPAELGIKGVDVSRPYFIQMRMRASAEEFMDALRRAFEQDFDPLELVYPGEVPVFDKYDEYVPEELVRKGFAYGVLDVDGARERVLGW